MRIKIKTRQDARIHRHARVRAKLSGTAQRPRLCVFRSLSATYGQLIDDANRTTICAASDRVIPGAAKKGKTERATLVGEHLAHEALKKGIKKVVFDRGGYAYQGRIRALAEGARKGGLIF